MTNWWKNVGLWHTRLKILCDLPPDTVHCAKVYCFVFDKTLQHPQWCVGPKKELYCGRMKYVSSPSVQLIIKVKNMYNMAHVKFSHCRMMVLQVFKFVYVSRFQCYSFEQNLTVFNACPCIQVCHQHVLLVGNITDTTHGYTRYRCVYINLWSCDNAVIIDSYSGRLVKYILYQTALSK